MILTTEASQASPRGMKVRTINFSKEKKNIGSLNDRFTSAFMTKFNTLVDKN